MFPIRAVFFPIESYLKHLSAPDVSGEGYARDEKKGIWETIKQMLAALGMAPILIISAPFKLLRILWEANRRDLLYGLPAVLMSFFLVFVFYRSYVGASKIDRRYRAAALRAVGDNNFQLAKTYFRRLVNRGNLDQNEQFQWAIILANSGEGERAANLINELAPDDQIGFQPAHEYKAVNISRTFGESKDVTKLKKLVWHLQNSRDTSPEIHRAWATYHLGAEQYDNAVKALRKSADVNPEHFLMIARIYQQQGRNSERLSILGEAEKDMRPG